MSNMICHQCDKNNHQHRLNLVWLENKYLLRQKQNGWKPWAFTYRGDDIDILLDFHYFHLYLESFISVWRVFKPSFIIQFCSGEEPVMRVFRTSLYQQEVMYTVLVHSPNDDEKFSNYPLLADDPNSVCSYRDGRIIWRSEAMCETHRWGEDKSPSIIEQNQRV